MIVLPLDANTYQCTIPSELNPIVDGSVIWSLLHYGIDGVDQTGYEMTTSISSDAGPSTRKVSFSIVSSNNTSVVLRIIPGLIGEVVLFAHYRATNGSTVIIEPLRVYQNDGDAAMVNISLGKTNMLMHSSDLEIIGLSGTYDNGTTRLLLAMPGDGYTYSSTDTNVAYFDSNGAIRALNPGSCTMTVTLSGLSASVSVNVIPNNDNFFCRQIIGTGKTQGSNLNASKELFESDHAANAGGRSVWFSWTSPDAGQVTVDTIGSSFDTLLAVYTNDSLEMLHQVASDHDGFSNRTSRVSFNAAANTEYQIAVDGFNGDSGNISLNLAFNRIGIPIITSQPESASVVLSQNTTLVVAATGSVPFAYQW
jgi:hypothetical protein